MTLLLILATIIFIIVSYLVHWWIKTKPFYDLAAKFEKPNGFISSPIIGHAKYFADPKVFLQMLISFKAPYSVAFLGSRIFYFLNDPNLFEEVIPNEKCLDRPKYLEQFKHMKEGIFIARGDIWRRHKKLFNPAFNQQMLNFYFNKFHRHDEELIKLLQSKVGQGVFDIKPIIQLNNSNKMFDCMFGIDDKNLQEKYYQSLEVALHGGNDRAFSLFYNFDIVHRLKSSYKAYEQCIQNLKTLSEEVISLILERCKKRQEENKDKNGGHEEQKGLIFLDYLMNCVENGTYKKENVHQEITTFIVASLDTTPGALTFACICLAMFPEIQEKAYQEICEVLGDRSFHPMDLPKLKYLHCIIKETLRLFPVAPYIIRQPSCDIKIGDHIFPKDSLITINFINVHYSSKYFKNPKQFDPDRFSLESEEAKSRHKFAHLPFSAGRRSCPGERFGILSLASTITVLLRRFRLETTYKSIEEIRLMHAFFLHAIDGYPIEIFPRL